MLMKLAWRNLWRRKRRTFLTALSVALGIAFCLFFTGLSDGMYGQIIAMATRLGAGYLVLEHPAYRNDQDLENTLRAGDALLGAVERTAGVDGYSLRLSAPGMVSTSHGTVGGGFDAVVPDLDRQVSLLVDKVVEGRYLDEEDDILIGRDLARKLQARIGSKVVVTAQDRESETVQELFRVAGIFETKSAMLDGFYFQVTLGKAQKMLGLSPAEVTQVGIYLPSDRLMKPVAREIEATGEVEQAGAVLLPWQEVMKELWNYIKVDNASNYIFQVLLFLVILAGVLNTVLMSVMERTYEFGVLLSLGMSRFRLMGMVLVECALLAALGIAAGAVLGGLENAYLQRHPIDFTEQMAGDTTVSGFFMEPVLRMDLTLDHFLFTLAVVFVLIMTVGVYPAWKAGRVEPVEALHSL